MPLIKSSSKPAFKQNVKTLMDEVGQSPHVQSRDQALAIAYSVKRRSRAEGGRVTPESVLPPDHKLGMRVPKGGSDCASCRFLASDTTCGNPGFVKWNGSAKLPAPKDQYCCDLYEASTKRAAGGAIRRAVKGYAEGGSPFDWSGVGEAMPEASVPRGTPEEFEEAHPYLPRMSDFRHALAENNRLSAEQAETGSALWPLTTVMGPVNAAFDTAQKTAARIGPGLEHAVDVAGWVTPGPAEVKAAAATLPAAGKVARTAKGADEVERVLEAERNLKAPAPVAEQALQSSAPTRNPGRRQLDSLLTNSGGSLRGYLDEGGAYMWDANHATHSDAAKSLGLNYDIDNRFYLSQARQNGDIKLDIGDKWRSPEAVLSNPHLQRILSNDRVIIENGSKGFVSGPEYLQELKEIAHERAATPIPDSAGATAAPEAGVDVSGGLGGPEGGRVGVEEAARKAARWAGARKPLEGLPVKPMDIRGYGTFQPGPIGSIHDVAEAYMREHRPEIAYAPPTEYRPIDREHSEAIAKAYDEMKHTPNDPATKASYNAMIDETAKQYEAIKKTGLKIEPIPPGMPDPYAANPRLAAHDVAENNHLWFFPTEQGFGTVNKISSNPLLRKMGEKIGDHEMTANDMFRVVHDYFGHLKEGHGFRAAGEDNAWRSHSAMYSDLARPAMTSETRGQNSAVNFSATPLYKAIGEAKARALYGDGAADVRGQNANDVAVGSRTGDFAPRDVGASQQTRMDAGAGADAGEAQPRWKTITVGEHNRTASGADTVYADQKVGLMPHWTMYDRGQAPPVAGHGSPYDYSGRPDPAKIGTGEGAMVYGAGHYLADRKSVYHNHYRQVLSRGQQWNGPDGPVQWNHIYDDLSGAMDLPGRRNLHPDQKRQIVDQIMNLMDRGRSAKTIRRDYAGPAGFEDHWNAAVDAAQKYKFNKNPGHTYEYAIEAPREHFLDWDVPLSQQSAHVQERLRPLVVNDVIRRKEAMRNSLDATKKELERSLAGVRRIDGRPNRSPVAIRRDIEDMEKRLADLSPETMSGRDIYRRMGLYNTTDPGPFINGRRVIKDENEGYRLSSNMLRELGIPGLRYLDQGSRGKTRGKKTYNHVIFNPDAIRLIRKYGLLGAPAAGVAADAAQDQQRAAGGRIHRDDGGAIPLPSHLDAMEQQAQNDPLLADSPITGVGLPRRSGIIPVGDFAPVPIDAPMKAARAAKRYAEPEFTPGGSRIINKGLDNPPDPSVQTVADPHRMMFPGIYRNPKDIAAEAAARVGPEDPAMKRLFGVTRGDLREMAQGRVGNEEPAVPLAQRFRGSLAAQNIQTPQNTQRMIDVLGEAGKHEGLRTADAWYIMDPVYRRIVAMGANDPRAQYKHLNTMIGMASPGSDTLTEIARGTGAYAMDRLGRFDDFARYAGIPEGYRSRIPFPADLKAVPGHPYHRTSQVEPMRKYLEAGSIQSDSPKVPAYVHASGVPETGFQTSLPVGDAHFSRAVGLADTRKGPTDVPASASRAEMQTLQPWWQHDVAGKVGMESVPAQARLWTVMGPQTGVMSELGAPKLELLSKQIMEAAQRRRISPETARDLVLSGKIGAYETGGAVDAAMNVARSIKRAKGGKVHVGPIVGDTGGRADKVPMRVPNGAYVFTADHVSGLGEGNTGAGMKKLAQMFPKSKPSLMRQLPHNDAVPIYAADGEFVVSPEDIKDRYGDLDHGHKMLDGWQTSERKKLIQTLATLAPPAQD